MLISDFARAGVTPYRFRYRKRRPVPILAPNSAHQPAHSSHISLAVESRRLRTGAGRVTGLEYDADVMRKRLRPVDTVTRRPQRGRPGLYWIALR